MTRSSSTRGKGLRGIARSIVAALYAQKQISTDMKLGKRGEHNSPTILLTAGGAGMTGGRREREQSFSAAIYFHRYPGSSKKVRLCNPWHPSTVLCKDTSGYVRVELHRISTDLYLIINMNICPHIHDTYM